MVVLLVYFLIAAATGVTTAGIVGYVLTKFVIDRFEKADQSIT